MATPHDVEMGSQPGPVQTHEGQTITEISSNSTTTVNAEPLPSTTNIDENHEETVTKDFGFLPIPKGLQHDPNRPPHFSLLLNIVFGIASTFLVANLYYCQPLLIQLSLSFGVTYNEVSRVPTLIQAGYATGLLLISPLGDLVRRRPLLIILTLLSLILTIPLAVTNSIQVFESFSFLVGATSVVPQVLMPLAADLAPPHRRASALSIVLSGLLLGVLIARVMAGIIAQFVTWRVVYYVALGVQGGVLVLLYWMIPDYPQRNKGMTYFGILWSMGKFLVTEPVLVQAVFVSMTSMATFTNFWVTLTFLLGGPPYFYSTLVIGLFGLVGMFGVAMAPLVGRTVDRLVPWFATMVSTILLLLFQVLQTGAGGINIAAVILTAFGIDVFRQMQQVSLTSHVFGLEVNARARLNAVLIIALFIGQVMGTSVGTKVFTQFGWRPAAALSVGWTGFSLIMLLLRGPNCKRYTWVGWEGGLEIRKSKVGGGGSGGGGEEGKDVEKKGADDGKGFRENEEKDDRMEVEDDSKITIEEGDEKRREREI